MEEPRETGTAIQFSESFAIEGRAMFAHACKVGLEGVVSKVRVRDRSIPAAAATTGSRRPARSERP